MDKRLNTHALHICEIFHSFQGESTWMGRPTIFIRLAGCNLRCRICDTKYALTPHKLVPHKIIPISKIIKLIKPLKTPYICITGGEPLCQKESVKKLIARLIKDGRKISIETNGSLTISGISKKVKCVMDVKTPSTGEEKSFCVKNLKLLGSDDEIKFVISNHADFKFSVNFIKKNKLDKKCRYILFSPNLSVKGLAQNLVNWILRSNLNIIFQPQLHKLTREKPVYILKRQNLT
ncbi:MAG: radical SAM protein [Pseudomonadota bacterium]